MGSISFFNWILPDRRHFNPFSSHERKRGTLMGISAVLREGSAENCEITGLYFNCERF